MKKVGRGKSRKRVRRNRVRLKGAPKQLLLPWQQGLTERDLITIRAAARTLIGRDGYTWSDFDDIAQDLTVHVLEHMHEYDPGRGAWFTFLGQILRNKVSHLAQYRTFQKRDYRKCMPLLP